LNNHNRIIRIDKIDFADNLASRKWSETKKLLTLSTLPELISKRVHYTKLTLLKFIKQPHHHIAWQSAIIPLNGIQI